MTPASSLKDCPNILVVEQAQIKGFRIVVYGNDSKIATKRIFDSLDALVEEGVIVEEVVHDGFSNIAKIASVWAQENGAMQIIFPSLWGQSDTNKTLRLLSTRPDLVVLFSDGQRDVDMVKQADKKNIRLWQPI